MRHLPTRLTAILYIVVISGPLVGVHAQQSASEFPPTCDGAIQQGYNCTRLEVVTEDGFFLGVYRLSKPELRNCSLPPVLLFHSLFGSYCSWLFGGPSSGLGYMLAEEGYDVWLTNSRGNEYSRAHKTLSSNDRAFWDWSWHEMGYYDLPATVDYMLTVTAHEQILFAGFSMGTNVFFVMCTTRPQYNDKVQYMIAMGPTIFTHNSTSELLDSKVPAFVLKNILDTKFGEGQVSNIEDVGRALAEMRKDCTSESTCYPLIQSKLFDIFGHNEDQWNKDHEHEIVKYYISGTSSKTLIHFSQLKTGKFQQFDYGPYKNKLVYKSASPPCYDLALVSTPMTLVVGDNDVMANSENVGILVSHLNNEVEILHVADPQFAHHDFILAKDVNDLVNKQVLNVFASKINMSSSADCS